jgi:hypothetical protein
MKTGYVGTWKRMQAARTPGEAAAIFVREYLKPRADLAAGRAAKYQRGVPGVEKYTGGDKVAGPGAPSGTRSIAPSDDTGTIRMSDSGGSFGAHNMTPDQLKEYSERALLARKAALTPEALIARGERSLMNRPGDLTADALRASAGRSDDVWGRVDRHVGGGVTTPVTGSVNVQITSNGTAARAKADADGLWQSTTVQSWKQMQPTSSPAGDIWSGS